jgi:hypothetical protein
MQGIYESGKKNFFKPPAVKIRGPQKDKIFNRMCCCSSHLPHNESKKFILLGDDEAN